MSSSDSFRSAVGSNKVMVNLASYPHCYVGGCTFANRCSLLIETNHRILADLLTKKFRLSGEKIANPDLRIEVVAVKRHALAGQLERDEEECPYLSNANRDSKGRIWVRKSPHWISCFDGRGKITLQIVESARPAEIFNALGSLSFLVELWLIERGYTLLHASAVAMEDHCWLIVGASGAGKSTIAGCFCAMGEALYSDDVTILTSSGKTIQALPGFENSYISALIDTSHLIGACGVASEIIEQAKEANRQYPKNPASDSDSEYKVWIHFPENSNALQPRPIGGILFPELRNFYEGEPMIEPLGPAKAIIELMSLNLSQQLPKSAKRRYFQDLALLSRSVPCYRLNMRRGCVSDIHDVRRHLREKVINHRHLLV